MPPKPQNPTIDSLTRISVRLTIREWIAIVVFTVGVGTAIAMGTGVQQDNVERDKECMKKLNAVETIQKSHHDALLIVTVQVQEIHRWMKEDRDRKAER